MSELALKKFTAEARQIVVKAQTLADDRCHKDVEPIHFLSAALEFPVFVEYLRSIDIDPKRVANSVSIILDEFSRDATDGQSYLSRSMILFLERSEEIAGNKMVSVEHLILSLSEETKGACVKLFRSLNMAPADIKSRIKARDIKKEEASSLPYLKNLTNLAKLGGLDPVIGRHVEVRRLIQILGRRHKNHPLLVGHTGVGKRSIVNALALKVASGNVSAKFDSLNIIHLDAGRLVAGAKARGDVEARMKKALASIKPEETILFIHGIDSLFNQSAALSGAGELLSGLLTQDNLRLITSTTPEGLRKIAEKDANIHHQFTVINIEPSSSDETVEILRGIAIKYETYHKVKVGDPAIISAVKLAKRYLQKRSLPESAIDLLDEASSRKKFEVDGMSAKSDVILSRLSSLKAQLVGLIGDEDVHSVKTRNELEREVSELTPEAENILTQLRRNRANSQCSACILTDEDIASVLEDWTGIPTTKMLEGESDKLSSMEETITKRVVGQNEAVAAIAKAVRRSRLGLRDLGKPIGSFLFLGPSGVGKTELAKSLSQFLFDSPDSLIRMDMSEYMEKHMAARLIGPPPGYVGSDEGGVLTEAVSKNPYSVLLFDEIEKAHPDVFNLLLQVLDDGRLTDGRGKTVDFTNTVIIMTSNIGSIKILESENQLDTSEGIEAMKADLQTDLRKLLRPELLNRIDETVIFRPLSKDLLKNIADIQLSLLEKMLSHKEIKLVVTDEAKEFLVNADYTPGYGARPLKRAILKYVQDALAERIMTGLTRDGNTVHVSIKENGLFFKEV